mmetsp:Transcript_9886/g.21093  ORF Transcript_9886/g.21093 Transcript_9886/m.21093 type:complete len:193 (-) Transcript_9886:542-1120(-)|eukprot:CAMPEP_0202900480 /NCGR_PEP_ID=MMETSP1392-20130828/11857_1 /ASSEMBLY_ACC=CAM_ASM_000868 /TAXON_ID=225041 /ORGANISM="Chlamydomonas chlamydogama, Strain SAG 11-48b" /LENGTH=192 /DNA_ID=CAMNT_0049586877 /DNA_START=124 /DNA_END=702 /DNA_ORIENTATION=+
MQQYPPPGLPNLADIQGPTSYETVGGYKLRSRSIAARHVGGDARCTLAAVGKAMVDAHNATVLNPQALGPGSELQRSLTDILVQLNSFDSKMNDQLNDKWTQLTAQLHDVACIGILGFNRSSQSVTDSIRALPPAPGQPAPPDFPSTRGGLMSMSSEAAVAFLQLYNLPTGGTQPERINRLARHIGIDRDLM